MQSIIAIAAHRYIVASGIASGDGWMDGIGVDHQLIFGKWVWRSSSITSFREVLTARGQLSVARVNKMDVINLGNEELTILGKASLRVKESLI